MPKPTQAEVAELVGRLRADGPIAGAGALLDEAADALEALAGEGAEPVAQCFTALLMEAKNVCAHNEFGQDVSLDPLRSACNACSDYVGAAQLLRTNQEPVAWMIINYKLHGGRDCRMVLQEPNESVKADEIVALYAAPPAKPAGELPPLPEPIFDDPKGHGRDLYSTYQMRAYALRALRERA